MGWFFRKSLNFGPFRLNFSKSGVGGSVGVKGARTGVNARGNKYFQIGRGGVGYRKEYGSSEPGEKRREARSSWLGWLTGFLLLCLGFAGGLAVGIAYGPNLKSRLNEIIEPSPTPATPSRREKT